MPPKAKFTREQIVKAAFEIARDRGIEAVTAREIASYLDTSTRPIFTHFESMEQITDAVTLKAKERYDEYIVTGLAMTPPFKGYGLQIIKFVKDEPELFKLIWANNQRFDSYDMYLKNEGHWDQVTGVISATFGLNKDDADWMFDNLLIYTRGLATVLLSGAYDFSDEEIDDRLSSICQRLVTGIKASGDEKYHFLKNNNMSNRP